MHWRPRRRAARKPISIGAPHNRRSTVQFTRSMAHTTGIAHSVNAGSTYTPMTWHGHPRKQPRGRRVPDGPPWTALRRIEAAQRRGGVQYKTSDIRQQKERPMPKQRERRVRMKTHGWSVTPRRRHRTRPTPPISDPGEKSLRTARGDRRPRRARAAADMMTCGVETRSSDTPGNSWGPTSTALRRGRGVWRVAWGAMVGQAGCQTRWGRAKAPMCQADQHSRASDLQSCRLPEGHFSSVSRTL